MKAKIFLMKDFYGIGIKIFPDHGRRRRIQARIPAINAKQAAGYAGAPGTPS
jgi:hypothetical protein